MQELGVKNEFKLDESQCHTCLSLGRKLKRLDKNVDLFRKILPQSDYWTNCDMGSVKICWECNGRLSKISEYQGQILRVTEMLELGQEYLYGTMSSLTTVIFNDAHPNTIYITQANETAHIDTKPETTGDIEYMDHLDAIDNNTTDNIEVKTESEAQITKIRVKNNKWAEKRALLNKKPKFKIIKDYIIFKKVKISQEELIDCIQKEKDSELYKSCKYKCKNCVLGFKDESCLANHDKKYHKLNIGSYVCDVCSTRTDRKTDLALHISTHYYKYQCTLCTYSSCHRTNREEHVKSHKVVLQCVKCELYFGSRRDFFAHYKEWHEKFVCDYCGVSFKMRYCIKDHIRKQHSPFECKLCNKRFSRYNGLWLHNKVCHSSSSQTAYCVECDRRYADVYRYRWHLSNSARHRPRPKTKIPCPGCDKVFTKKIYMKDHYDLVHLKKYKYRCQPCDKNYLRNADLVQHRRRVHEGILPPKNKICYICGRGFTTNKILSNHVRTHTGERPFACARCPAAFAQPHARAQHQRARHSQRDQQRDHLES